MTVLVWIVMGGLALLCVALYVATVRIERHRALWEEFHHPPDMRWEDDDEQDTRQ